MNTLIERLDQHIAMMAPHQRERQAGKLLVDLRDCLNLAPVAIMDTRTALGLCAPTEADFPALYALQGHRVALVDLGPNV